MTDTTFNDDEKELARLDLGWAKCALALRNGIRYGHAPRELRVRSLSAVYEELEARRLRLARGDSMETLHAIALCAEENVPLPTWLAVAYRDAFAEFLKPGGAPSLDATFASSSLPTSTPKKAAAAKQDWQLGIELLAAVWKVADKHAALDSALIEVLAGKDWGVKKTKARRLVETVEKTHRELSGVESLSQFWSKRRNANTSG